MSATFSLQKAYRDVRSLVFPLMDSAAFNRLREISFLGILSPRYADIAKNPIYKRPTVRNRSLVRDGSRADHSVGVAILAVQICKSLRLSEEEQKYAAAWGLLHDLGNWPLSHTAQHAFSEVLGVQTKSLREWMIVNDKRSPVKYHVADELERSGIEPERLLLLFRKTPDRALQTVSDIYRNKLTPDMIEGVWRSGRSFGVERYDPSDFCSIWHHDLADDYALRPESINDAVHFWRTKREIYARFFSSSLTVQFESQWSRAVYAHLLRADTTLEGCLELPEEELVKRVAGDIPKSTEEICRWKPPVRQVLKKKYPDRLTMDSVNTVFEEESISKNEL